MALMSELQLFILRAEAIKLYRQYLRLLRQAPPSARVEVQKQVRHEFDQAKRLPAEPYSIKYALSDGRARLKQLRDMLALSE